MKEELLRLLEIGRAKEVEEIVPQVDDSEPSKPGEWTIKDHLAHLSAWREAAAADIASVLHGTPVRERTGGTDEQNAAIYAETHGFSAKEVIARAERSWAELASRIGEATDDQLHGPRPGNPSQELWEAVPGNSFGHVGEHVGFLAADAGDEAGAEAGARWAYEQNVAIPSEAARANGQYNFGCFYARRGRAREALPYLRESIQARPDLKEWARKDSDLDPIRAEPEVEELLAG